MRQFELILSVFVAAVLLAAAARRVGAPYPAFLALGGALLAFVPGVPSLTLPPNSRSRCSSLRSCSMPPTTHRCATCETTGHP